MKKLNSHMFEDVYKKLNIDLDELGCIMLDIEHVKGVNIQEDWLYYTTDKKKFWYLFGHPSGKAQKTHWITFMKDN